MARVPPVSASTTGVRPGPPGTDMSLRRELVRHVLIDAELDRESYLDSVRGLPEYEGTAEENLEVTRALLARYQAGGRVSLSPEDLRTVRRAGHWALSWRETFLDSISGTGDRAHIAAIRVEVRQAKSVIVAAGGSVEDPLLANATSISITDLAKSDRGTMVKVEWAEGGEIRHVSENGVPLGRIETDDLGTVKLILADGKIVNDPFESAADAQQWLLRKFSNNVIFAIHRMTDDEEETAGPRM